MDSWGRVLSSVAQHVASGLGGEGYGFGNPRAGMHISAGLHSSCMMWVE